VRILIKRLQSALTQHDLEDVLKGRKSKEKQAAKKAAGHQGSNFAIL